MKGLLEGVAYEYDRDVLASVQGVDRLGGSDAGEVSVTLMGKSLQPCNSKKVQHSFCRLCGGVALRKG